MLDRRNPALRFLRRLNRITPNPGETERLDSRKSMIRKRLQKSFNVAGIQLIGSYSRGTSIAHHSDVDLLVTLRRNEAKWGGAMTSSFTVLDRVRSDLDSRFQTTDVRRDKQASVVGFAQGRQRVDVVPALFSRMLDKAPCFLIPDGNGGWLETCPRGHLIYLRRAQARSKGKFYKTVQLLKHWKSTRIPTTHLRSFYIELWLAEARVCEGVKSYAQILNDIFGHWGRYGFKRLSDPLALSSGISAVQTQVQLEQLNAAAELAANHANRAIVATHNKQFVEANDRWGTVFNGQF